MITTADRKRVYVLDVVCFLPYDLNRKKNLEVEMEIRRKRT